MTQPPTRSLRRLYLEWVEEEIECFKERIPRAELLALADEVVEDLRVNRRGQYQITELLLCDAVDRRIFQMLKLPGYRAWAASYRPAPEEPSAEEVLAGAPEEAEPVLEAAAVG